MSFHCSRVSVVSQAVLRVLGIKEGPGRDPALLELTLWWKIQLANRPCNMGW